MSARRKLQYLLGISVVALGVGAAGLAFAGAAPADTGGTVAVQSTSEPPVGTPPAQPAAKSPTATATSDRSCPRPAPKPPTPRLPRKPYRAALPMPVPGTRTASATPETTRWMATHAPVPAPGLLLSGAV